MDQYDRLKRVSQLRNSRVRALRQAFLTAAPTTQPTPTTPTTPGTPATTPGIVPTASQTFLAAFGGRAHRSTGPVAMGTAVWPPTLVLDPAPVVPSQRVWAEKSWGASFDGVYEAFVAVTGLMRFDTSQIPDSAVVTGAVLRVYELRARDEAMDFGGSGTLSKPGENRSLTFGWDPWVEDASAWTADQATSAHPGLPLRSLPQAGRGWTEIPLQNANANVSKTGLTYLKATISGGAPSKTLGSAAVWAQVMFYSSGLEEFGLSTPEYAPRLVVGYA